MRKQAEPPPPKGWTAEEWDKHLNRKEKAGFYGTLYPNAGEKISSMDDIELGDPTHLMPRLRQIHKLGYRLQGKTDFQGLPIAIENRKGSVRSGKDDDGHEWRTKMKHPYGYIKGTKGADGEGVDVFVGPDKEAPAAFVVHQRDKETGKYDEDKVMLGFRSKKEAKEAFLMHYDDPKFLGPMAKVSMDRLRELVASKKQLTKISAVQGQALLEELMLLQKVAFDLGDARRVLRVAKERVLKVPRIRQAQKRIQRALQSGATEAPQGMSMAETMLAAGGGGAPMAVSRTAAKEMRQMVGQGVIGGPLTSPELLRSTQRLQGRILTAKGGDATAAIRRHPAIGEAVAGPIAQMTPQQRIMHNATIKAHELAEQSIKGKGRPTAFGIMTGHRGAQAPLTDANILATLPKGNEPIRQVVQSYRPAEAHLLEQATRGVGGRPGIEYGSQRLSRHARKRVAKRMEDLATEDLQRALAGPEGEQIRAQLRAGGIQEMHGIGKLSAARPPQAPQTLSTWQRVRKAGPGIGGLLGAGVGAVMGARRGKLLKGTLAGLGTGATLGWIPDMASGVRRGIQGRTQ